MISNNVWVLIFLIILFFIFSVFFVWPWLFGAPFEPSDDRKVKTIIKLARIKKGEKAVDLGSGNGKIVIALAKAGAEAHGYEINPLLVFVSKRNIKNAGLENKAFVHWKSFWKVNLGKFKVITLFQFPTIMNRLERKFNRELKKGARVVSEEWLLKGWEPIKKKDSVYLYKK